MTKSKKRFTVAITERAGRPPIEVPFSNLAAARKAASGYRGCLTPGTRGEVCILDADGERIERWTASKLSSVGADTDVPG